MNKVRITYLVLSALLGIFPGFVAKVKAQIITGGFSYEGSITISPESPVADWRPMHNDENQPLFPGDSARLTVVIDDGDSEKYERVKGPDVTVPYSNGLWAVSSISESQVVLAATNTGNSGSGIQTATVTTQWKKKGSGGGGGGPGGGGDSLINGIAIGIAEVGVLAGDWSFSDRLQKADGRSPISVSLEVTGGGALVRFKPQEMEPFELTPADAVWTIDTPPPPVTGTTRSWSYVANVTSETPSEGKMKLPFNTGGELRSSSLLQFAIVDLQVESGPKSGKFLKEELNTNGSNATPPHEIMPGGILPVVPIPPAGGTVALDGKLLKLQIVLDDNAKKHGRVKLETEAGATGKVLVYTGSDGTGPVELPMEWQVGAIPSALYVRATSNFIIQGFLKLTYFRDFILPAVTAHLDDDSGLLPFEVELSHIEPGTQTMSSKTVLRDEIFGLRIKILPLGTSDWNIALDVTPNAMRTSDLQAPGSTTPRNGVLMFDFATADAANGNRWESITANSDGTVNSIGTTKAGPYMIKLESSKAGEISMLGTFNKEGTLKIRLRSGSASGTLDDMIDVESSELSIQTRLRQYAEYEDSEAAFREPDGFGGTRGAKNKHSNEYDQAFVDATNAWVDWGYGFTGEGNYTFGLPATLNGLRDPELLKSIAFNETAMNPIEAQKNSPHPNDIMQLEAGATGNEINRLNGNGTSVDFNASATKVTIHGRKLLSTNPKVYETARDHVVYLLSEGIGTGNPAPATNYGWPLLHYSTHQPPGPASSATVAENIRWAMRDLLLRSKFLTGIGITIDPDGPDGDTSYGLDPQWKTGINEVLNQYGPASPPYGPLVRRFQFEGRSGDRFGWPRLVTKTARH